MALSSSNPWLSLSSAQEPENEEPEVEPTPTVVTSPSGPALPQQGVPVVEGLPRVYVNAPARLWWVNVHGGAGGSTLASVVEGSAVTHGWPEVANSDVAPRVVLVARTHASGLLAAQAAATEWASGSTGADLLGLVLVADAPGRLPRPLKDMTKLVSGGVPRAWRIPWHEPWRVGEAPTLQASPRPVRALVAELDTLAPNMN